MSSNYEYPTENPGHESLGQRRIAQQFRELVAGTEDLLRSTAEYTGAEIESARARLAEQLETARSAVEEWEHSDLRARAAHWSEAADRCVHEHTWAAIGIAAGVGLVVGCFVGGDHHRHY